MDGGEGPIYSGGKCLPLRYHRHVSGLRYGLTIVLDEVFR